MKNRWTLEKRRKLNINHKKSETRNRGNKRRIPRIKFEWHNKCGEARHLRKKKKIRYTSDCTINGHPKPYIFILKRISVEGFNLLMASFTFSSAKSSKFWIGDI